MTQERAERAGASMARQAAAVAWGIALLMLVSQAWIYWLVRTNADELPRSFGEFLPAYAAFVIVGPLFPALGAVILRRLPRHPVGWLMCAAALTGVADAAARGYAIQGIYLGELPHADYAAWVAEWMWLPAIVILLVFVPLYFPTGRLPGPRWSWVARALVGWAVLTNIGYALAPTEAVDFPDVTQPVEVPEAIVLAWGMLLLPVAIAIALGSLVVRRRRAVGEEREQLRWLLYAVGLGAAIYGQAQFAGLVSGGTASFGVLDAVVTWTPLVLVPVAITVAITKYRLYDIDVLINRTLVYGLLTAGVLALYGLVVLGVSSFSSSDLEWRGPVLVVVAVAIIAQPLRELLQRGVNRLMYGDRDDPARAMSRLARRVSDSLTPAALLAAVAETIGQALRLPYVEVRLADGMAAAVHGTPRSEPARFPLVHQGEPVGALLVGRRADTEPLTAADRLVLEDIARQVAVAAHAVRLSADLQGSRERLVLAREEERRRLRRDLHDGVGSALAGLALQAGNARTSLPGSPEDAAAWLQKLEDGIRTVVVDIRRIVDDLRPPALDELGLTGALQERAEAMGGQVRTGLNGVQLPAALEVAAYRIGTEALANAARHSDADHVSLRLTVDGTPPALHLLVRDDGIGLGEGGPAGVGLRSMRERAEEVGGTCEAGPAPGGGTLVAAVLPIPPTDVPEVR